MGISFFFPVKTKKTPLLRVTAKYPFSIQIGRLIFMTSALLEFPRLSLYLQYDTGEGFFACTNIRCG